MSVHEQYINELLSGRVSLSPREVAAANEIRALRSQLGGAPDATVAAADLADEHGLDLAAIQGSGEGGRILLSDVQDLLGE